MENKYEKCISSAHVAILALQMSDEGAKFFKENNPSLKDKFLNQNRLEDCVAKFCFGIDVPINVID